MPNTALRISALCETIFSLTSCLFGTLRNNNLGTSLPAGAFFNANRRLRENQVQAGFSYKFDTYAPVPVVAKY